jgi:hypothetical protein
MEGVDGESSGLAVLQLSFEAAERLDMLNLRDQLLALVYCDGVSQIRLKPKLGEVIKLDTNPVAINLHLANNDFYHPGVAPLALWIKQRVAEVGDDRPLHPEGDILVDAEIGRVIQTITHPAIVAVRLAVPWVEPVDSWIGRGKGEGKAIISNDPPELSDRRPILQVNATNNDEALDLRAQRFEECWALLEKCPINAFNARFLDFSDTTLKVYWDLGDLGEDLGISVRKSNYRRRFLRNLAEKLYKRDVVGRVKDLMRGLAGRARPLGLLNEDQKLHLPAELKFSQHEGRTVIGFLADIYGGGAT